jgi:hypothetical protein
LEQASDITILEEPVVYLLEPTAYLLGNYLFGYFTDAFLVLQEFDGTDNETDERDDEQAKRVKGVERA